ncbi:MAG TPA: hypothetical protein VG897_19645 [Terriglobales bacterium]|nr:hypothetical protein [Terriglobales bacterium]
MPRCSDPRDLSELDPVTFFIVTELMAAERERAAIDLPNSKERAESARFAAAGLQK